MSVTLTVLGSSGTYPARGRACSSYLVEAEGTALLLDCGNGALSNLTRIRDVTDLDAVLLSHLHPDHFVDVYGLFYALRFHPSGPQAVDVYAPPGAGGHIARLLSDPAGLDAHCFFHEVRAGDVFKIGSLEISLFAAAHPVETIATRIDTGDLVLAYSGDTGPSHGIIECARDADLFVCDSTWLEADGPHPKELHMTGADAGRHAQRAGAARLMITHVLPSNDPRVVAAEAAEHYTGEILIADDLEEYRL